MANHARAAVFLGAGNVEVREYPIPSIGPEDGLLQLELAGVCASDAGRYYGKNAVKTKPPLILGHEILGHIAAVGPVAAQRWGVQPGDRVVVESTIRCDACRYCHNGQYHLCDNRAGYGNTRNVAVPPSLWGGYAQSMYLHPKSMVHKISPEVPDGAAVLVGAVLGNAFRWVGHFGNVRPGDTVVVQGCGSQGLAAVVAARECGAGCIVVTGLDSDGQRLILARELGADHVVDVNRDNLVEYVQDITGGRLADVVVELSGAPASIATSLEIVRKQGRIVQAGLTGAATLTPLLLDRLIFKEVMLQGVFAHTRGGVEQAIQVVESRRYPLEKIVTHRYGLDELALAFAVTARKMPGVDAIKVALEPNRSPSPAP